MEQQGFDLTGKVALVTGAGKSGSIAGTGQAIATLLARQGAKVMLVDLNRENAKKTLAAIQAEGGDAAVFRADVSREDECKAMVEAAVTQFGGLHILVNNVGIHGDGAVTTVDEATWDRTMAVNLKGMVWASKYAIPAMIESGRGSIINISSVDGLRAGPWHNLPYSVSKGGVVTLTIHMAVHHGRAGIRVNCIAPGMIYGAMIGDRLDDDMRTMRREATPLGTEGTAWDIGWAAVFLASDAARWVTGVTLPVDAGATVSTPISALMRLNQ